jgi:hypothetical protein
MTTMPSLSLDRPAVRALRDGAIIAGLLFGAYLFVFAAPAAGTFGFDAYAYWSVDPRSPYDATAGAFGAFTYSPPIAWLFAPFSLLSWPTFIVLWTGLLLGTAIWLGGRWWLAVLAFPPVALELYHGNINLLMAFAIVLGFRWPATWAFVLLTKVTPGVGLLWFAVRREWRPLAIALAVTGVIAGVSLLLEPDVWRSWVEDSLLATAQGAPLNQFSITIPLVVRLPAAAILVAWGARTDRPWTVVVAATIALPVMWVPGFSMLAALFAVSQRRPGLTDAATLRLKGSG